MRRTERGPGLEQVAVIALAADRLARAISIDDISEPLRDRVDRWAGRASSERQRRRRAKVAELVHCPVCVGWWTSLLASAAWPGRMRMRRGVAVAGAQVVLTLAARLVSEQGRVAIEHADLVASRNGSDDDAIGAPLTAMPDAAAPGRPA